VADYDLRTTLHLAACNGMVDCVNYIITQAQATDDPATAILAKDRFGHTAYDDCVREGQDECAAILKGWDKSKFMTLKVIKNFKHMVEKKH
jgi:ankyrin repeat protein